MMPTYKAVSGEQEYAFLIEIRDGKRWVGYLKNRQVPPELAYLIRPGGGAMGVAQCATRQEAQLLASSMNVKRILL